MKITFATTTKSLLWGFFVFMFVSCGGNTSERDAALSFLYQYMPLPDSVDYSREFWEQQVEVSLQARREMPWGKSVSNRDWRHFVLPVRVNNENLDSARVVFYHELKDRVKGLSMYDAALEVNHWCHEHVTYQPSDSRTSSPLATLRSAIGRCGEESTFAVAALRSVCIPARQVYTPRWAHTDDNHAWVEVLVDGEWHFLGACEPEPVLDLGWFNAPASRGMLMHTRVFGRYDGGEEILSQDRCYTEINVTANYAPVSTVTVLAREATRVDFCIYNYGEYYKAASKAPDADGIVSLTAGHGDMLVWATDGQRFGFAKVTVGDPCQQLVEVPLSFDVDSHVDVDLDMVPPAERNTLPELTDEQVTNNKQRLAQEDSIRNAYMLNAFYDGPDELLRAARANHTLLAEFLANNPGEEARAYLETLSQKDLRDVEPAALYDNFCSFCPKWSTSLWRQYVLCPRVSNEKLTVWKGEFFNMILARQLPDDINLWVQWVGDSIAIDESRNPQRLCMSPQGVLRHRVADAHSRDIFFVCGARAMGVPARIDAVTGKVQWADEHDQWHDVHFGSYAETLPASSTLKLTPTCDLKPQPLNLSYYTHFTLSRIVDGRLVLQEYPEGEFDFSQSLPVDAGTYLLSTGTRLANGSVLSHVKIFRVATDEHVSQPVEMRLSTDQLQVIGSFDSEGVYVPFDVDIAPSSQGQGQSQGPKSYLSTTGRGYYVVGLIRANHEPSNHALRDLIAARSQVEGWGRSLILLFPSEEEARQFRPQDFPGLPANVVFGIQQGDVLNDLQAQHLTPSRDVPVFLMADTFNRIVWLRQGYTIGLGEQLVEVIKKL